MKRGRIIQLILLMLVVLHLVGLVRSADGASEVAVNGHLFRIAPPLPEPRYTEQDVLQKLHDYFHK